MKKQLVSQCSAVIAGLAILSAGTARAVDQTKADNNTALDQAGSWVGNAVPGQTDRAIWDGTLSAADCTNTANINAINVGQIQIKSPSAGVTVSISKGTSNPWWRLYGVSGAAIDMSAATVDLVIGSGFTVQPQSSGVFFTNKTGRTLTISGGLYVGSSSGKTLILDGGGNYVFSGSLSGGGTLQKQGGGAVTIQSANYNNGFVLNAGTFNMNHNFCINGNSGSTLTINGGTIDNTSGGAIGLTANAPSHNWNGDFTFAGTGNLNLGGGAVTLGGNRQVTCNNANTLTVGGAIGDSGGGYSLTKAGAGTLNLGGTETYTGNTVVSQGTLVLAQNVFGGQLASPSILVGNGGTLDISIRGWQGSGSQSLGGAGTSGTGTVYGRDVVLNSGDGLSFQAAGGGSPSVGQIYISHNAGSLHLNNNTVTIDVTGAPLGVTTNTLLTDSALISGVANTVPVFTGLALSNTCGAAIITRSSIAGTNVVLVVTNIPQVGETTTTSVALTTGTNPQTYGGELDFTATVTGQSTSPTGNVIFKDGLTILSTVALTAGTAPVSTAVYTEFTDLKVAGSPHSITAYYQSDSTHNVSDSSGSPLSQTITQKPLTYSGLTAGTATYNGTNIATLGGAAALQTAEMPGPGTTADGTPYTVDSVAVGGAAVGTLAAKDVGNKAVTITGVTLTGTGNGNYSLLQETDLVQTVTAKALTVTGLAVTNKLYDGTTTAGFTTNSVATLQAAEAGGTGTTIDGKRYTGDSVSLATNTPVPAFAIPAVSNNIPVYVTGLVLTGATTNDYYLQEPVLSANIYGLYPGDQIRADNNYDLSGGAAWVSNTVPTGANWAIYTGPYNTATLTDTLGATLTLGGIMVSNVTGLATNGTGVEITGDANSWLALGGVGGKAVEMSAATVDLTIAVARIALTNNVAFNVPTGRTFTFANTVSPFAFNLDNLFGGGGPDTGHNLMLNGGGNCVFNGNLYDNTGNAVVTINGVNGGSGSCTLNAVGYLKHYVLNSGTLKLGHAYAVSGSTVILNGGTIDNTTGGAMTLAGAPGFSWNGDFTFADSSDLNLGSGAVTLGGNRTVTVNAGTLTVGGAVGDGGHGYSLTAAGPGTLKLSGANTYTGNTSVNAGTLAIEQATLATNSTVSIAVANGATLELDFAVTNTVTSLFLDGAPQTAGVYGSNYGTPGFSGAGSLLVLVLGSTTPAPAIITNSLSGNVLTLNWPAGQGWNLLSNSVSLANTNAWQPVTGATPPFPITINPATPAVFYRLTQ